MRWTRTVQTFGELYEEKLEEWLTTVNGRMAVLDLLLNDHRARYFAFERWTKEGPWKCSVCGSEFWGGEVVTEGDAVLCGVCRRQREQ